MWALLFVALKVIDFIFYLIDCAQDVYVYLATIFYIPECEVSDFVIETNLGINDTKKIKFIISNYASIHQHSIIISARKLRLYYNNITITCSKMTNNAPQISKLELSQNLCNDKCIISDVVWLYGAPSISILDYTSSDSE